MNQLKRLRNVVLDYISPVRKRRRILGPNTATPKNEDIFLPPDSEPENKIMSTTTLKLTCQNDLLLSQNRNLSCNSRNSPKRTREDFENNITEESFSSNCSISQNSALFNGKIDWFYDESKNKDLFPNFELKNNSNSVDMDHELFQDDESKRLVLNYVGHENRESDEIKVNVHEYFDRQAELVSRTKDVERAKALGDWHSDEIFLFERLSLRGFEVLLPKSWRIDFPTLPEAIFAEHEDIPTLVNTNFTSSAYGMKALQSLLSLGVRVRDNLVTRARTDKLISREIKNYIRWSERDGNYAKTRYLPVLVKVVARPRQTIDSLSATIDNQMRFLAEKYRKILTIPHMKEEEDNQFEIKDFYVRPPPLLYGIIVARTVVIFVTLDSSMPDAAVRHMQHFDFREKGTDAWIGFAIAILVIISRNYIMSIKNELGEDESDIDVDL